MKNLSVPFLLLFISFSSFSQNEIKATAGLGVGYSKFVGKLVGKFVTYSNTSISYGVGVNLTKKINNKISYLPEIGINKMGYSVRINDFFFEPKTKSNYSSYRLYTGTEFNLLLLEKKKKRGALKKYSCGIQPLISYQLYGLWKYDSDDALKINTKYSNFDLGLNFKLNYQFTSRKKRGWGIGFSYYLGVLPTLEDRGQKAYLRGLNLNVDSQLRKGKTAKRRK